MEVVRYIGYEEIMLKIMVQTIGGERTIRLVVSDAEKMNTVFTNRYSVFDGTRHFFVRMPLSPRVARIQVFDDELGPQEVDKTFRMVDEDGNPDPRENGIYRLPLVKNTAEVDIRNADIRSFVKLGESFSYEAGYLDTGIYQSANGKILLEYWPTLFEEDGESATPARIREDDKGIEISQKIFIPFTVPMRFAILCHEFAHCYLNRVPENEVEADLQGVHLYLCLGFPRIEAKEAFLETFIGTRSALNAHRYDVVEWYIDSFDQQKMVNGINE